MSVWQLSGAICSAIMELSAVARASQRARAARKAWGTVYVYCRSLIYTVQAHAPNAPLEQRMALLRWTIVLPYVMRTHLLDYKDGSDSVEELLTADEVRLPASRAQTASVPARMLRGQASLSCLFLELHGRGFLSDWHCLSVSCPGVGCRPARWPGSTNLPLPKATPPPGVASRICQVGRRLVGGRASEKSTSHLSQAKFLRKHSEHISPHHPLRAVTFLCALLARMDLPPIARSQMVDNLDGYALACGICERISRTPIPLPYARCAPD